MPRVAIIGGGISGLAAAHRIRELGAMRESPVEVTLLEGSAHLGGAIETITRDDFVIETGADSFLTEKPQAADLARRLGLESELIPTREEFRRTYVVYRGRLLPIPTGFSLIAPTHLGPVFASRLFTPWGKIRIAMEPFIPAPRGHEDESLASFVTRRLGHEVLDRIAQALAGGIYTADPERLSIHATLPRFPAMERKYGSLIRGLQAAENVRASKASETSGARWNLFLSLRGGMRTLVNALAGRLKDSIRTEASVAALSREGDQWRLEIPGGAGLDADAIICAAPAFSAARLLRRHSARLADVIGYVEYASAATVNMTFRSADFPKPPDGTGFVVPIAEKRKIIAGSFSSLKFENRAPAGSILMRAFLGGSLQSEMMNLSDDEMIAAALDEIRSLLNLTARPGITEVRRWPSSMPQYTLGHIDRIAEVERLAADIPDFHLAGAAYHGVGIPDCIRSAESAADAAFGRLTTRN